VLQLYRKLLRLRRAEPALSIGGYHAVSADENVLVFERFHQQRKLRIALNFDDHAKTLPAAAATGHILLSSYLDTPSATSSAELRPSEGVITELD
jgi:alpha-glucosidase